MPREKIEKEVVNRKGMLVWELEELEKKQKELEQLKKQKSQELHQIEKEHPNLAINWEIIKKKKYFYCGHCQGHCQGLEKGYFH